MVCICKASVNASAASGSCSSPPLFLETHAKILILLIMLCRAAERVTALLNGLQPESFPILQCLLRTRCWQQPYGQFHHSNDHDAVIMLITIVLITLFASWAGY